MNEKKEILKPQCPNCNVILDKATGLEEKDIPSKGDYSICLHCGEILIFDDNLSVRKPTFYEITYLMNNNSKTLLILIRTSSLIKQNILAKMN